SDDIRFTFTFVAAVGDSFPFALNLGDGLGFVSFDAAGEVAVSAKATVRLTIGLNTAKDVPILDRVFFGTVDPTDPADPPEITVALTASAGYDLDNDATVGDDPDEAAPLQFNASVGPISAGIVNGQGLIRLEAKADILDGGDNDGKLTLSDI